VAFARSGKSVKGPFWGQVLIGRGAAMPARKLSFFNGFSGLQRFLKPRGIRSGVRGHFDQLECETRQSIEMDAITKKREARRSLRQPGWISFEGGFAARQCVVEDLSGTGAKVTLDDPNTLPTKLRLALTRDARTGRSCEVVWRRGKSVGIKFVG
jgi:hypothetical protein